jgi:hypothetical protein
MKLYFKLFVIFLLFALAVALYYNVRYTMDEAFTSAEISRVNSILTATNLSDSDKIITIKSLKIDSKMINKILNYRKMSHQKKVTKLLDLIKNTDVKNIN